MTDPDFLSLPPEHTILTPRLRLRTARLSDAEACKSFICDYETMKYSTTGAVAKNDLGAVENWMKARVLGSEVFQFVVTLRGGHDDDGDEGRKEEARGKTKEEVVIGMLGSHHAPEVGYLLDPGEFFLTSFFGCPLVSSCMGEGEGSISDRMQKIEASQRILSLAPFNLSNLPTSQIHHHQLEV